MPADTTLPMNASVMLKSFSIPSLAIAPLTAIAPSSGARTEEREPLNLAMGVRAKLTITGLFIMVLLVEIICFDRRKNSFVL
jgi:hypothetical protein